MNKTCHCFTRLVIGQVLGSYFWDQKRFLCQNLTLKSQSIMTDRPNQIVNQLWSFSWKHETHKLNTYTESVYTHSFTK